LLGRLKVKAGWLLNLFQSEAFAELPKTFASKRMGSMRELANAPWSAAHELGYISYYPNRFVQAHIKLNHHLIGFEFEPGVVRVQLDTGPTLDRIIRSGSFYFVPAGTKVEVRKEHICENLLITLDPQVCERLIPGLSLLPMLENVESDAISKLAFDFRRALLAGLLLPSVVPNLVDALLVSLRQRISGPGPQNAPIGISPNRIKRALDFIEENYAANVSVEDIASAVGGISVFHFAHVFRTAIGRAPYRCVVERKLHQARILLSETSDDIANVAYVAGFASQAHMTETFSRRIGVTPAQFRRISYTQLAAALPSL